MKIVELIQQEAKEEKEDSVVQRMFYPNDRYLIDFNPDFIWEGWKQYDTDQDAHYFGQWVNPEMLVALCYCEGDWILESCPNAQAYNAMIDRMNAFYDEGIIAITYDEDNTRTVYRQDRQEFYI